ncbi:MAG: 3-methyl-2-oxobutanoate hydroxymethyltransferase [Verrucomicrobia bacterium]|nr:3-methyl-2-oxobutanoate hydroxymethyltransferase [Verrucomicrobiota bacterium]
MTTIQSILDRKGSGQAIAALTAYDYPTARLLDEAGVDILLVGDSLGMTVLGHPDTTQVRLEDILHHTRAVVRARPSALVVADLPIATYDNAKAAVVSAKELVKAGAQAVKLEGGQHCAAQIRAITQSGTPVMAHIGMLPQQIRKEGGYRKKGKTAEERSSLLTDAETVEVNGAFAVVLELIESSVAAEITRRLRIPTIGIGSGTNCDGQILVVHDLIGFFPWFRPKHAQPEADVAGEISKAVSAYIKKIRKAEEL